MMPPPPELPARLGEYDVLHEVGRGPNGFVCLVRGPDGREFAAKCLHPRFADDETRATRFEREALVTRSLAHPHIVRVHRVVCRPGSAIPFYLMDYLSSGHIGQFR